MAASFKVNRITRIFGYREVGTVLFWRDLFAEFFCSLLMLLPLTLNYVVYSESFKVTPTHAGIVMGFTVGALIETFGHISGGHMNPLVTWVMLWRGDISVTRALFYIIFQCGGSAAGSAIVYGFTPDEFRPQFQPFQPAPELGPCRGLAVEAVLSFIHMMIVQGVTDPFRKTACNIPGIPIGFSIALNVMIGFTYTGGAFNPIIAFGPAVISRNFNLHWIYWVGDFAGASVAVIVMNTLRYVGRPQEVNLKIALFYIIFQCGGSAAGSAIVYGFTPDEFRPQFQPFQPAPELGPYRGLAVEAVLSFIHLMIVQGVTDPFRKTACNIPGIPIGFSIALNVMIGFTYTGGAINPIIAFGPAVISRNFNLHWIYWVGDFTGASGAVIVMNTLRYVGRRQDAIQKIDAIQPLSYIPTECDKGEKVDFNSSNSLANVKMD